MDLGHVEAGLILVRAASRARAILGQPHDGLVTGDALDKIAQIIGVLTSPQRPRVIEFLLPDDRPLLQREAGSA